MLDPSASVDGVKAAISAEYRMSIEYLLVTQGSETKFNGSNELSDNHKRDIDPCTV